MSDKNWKWLFLSWLIGWWPAIVWGRNISSDNESSLSTVMMVYILSFTAIAAAARKNFYKTNQDFTPPTSLLSRLLWSFSTGMFASAAASLFVMTWPRYLWLHALTMPPVIIIGWFSLKYWEDNK